MNKTLLGLMCGVAVVVLLLIPTSSGPQPPIPNPVDPTEAKTPPEVLNAFSTYRRLWMDLNQKAAAKLDSGEFTTQQQVWDFIASGQEPARRIAFEKIAKHEQEVLGDGKWTPQLHSELLKQYGAK